MLKSELAKFLIDSITAVGDTEVILAENKYPKILREYNIVRMDINLNDIGDSIDECCGNEEVLILGYHK